MMPSTSLSPRCVVLLLTMVRPTPSRVGTAKEFDTCAQPRRDRRAAFHSRGEAVELKRVERIGVPKRLKAVGSWNVILQRLESDLRLGCGAPRTDDDEHSREDAQSRHASCSVQRQRRDGNLSVRQFWPAFPSGPGAGTRTAEQRRGG